jgi:DNA mismatch repair ATPase MutS
MCAIPVSHTTPRKITLKIDRKVIVAICEQVGDQPIKGLVPEVTWFTPGTIVEPGCCQVINNYLACIVSQENQ